MILSETLAKILDDIERAKVVYGQKHHTVEIVAITKTFSYQIIEQAYNAGIRTIGENRVQEAVAKFSLLPPLYGLQKRLVGHLQSNKVGKAVDLFDTIDSIDSMKIAKKISIEATKRGKTVSVLLQVNTSNDPVKFGFNSDQIENMLLLTDFKGIKVEGLMTIGIFTREEELIRKTFSKLREILGDLNQQLPSHKRLTHLSMGMSGDYKIAVEEGATMVRLGTALFGLRR